jgi:hypothetical protein
MAEKESLMTALWKISNSGQYFATKEATIQYDAQARDNRVAQERG